MDLSSLCERHGVRARGAAVAIAAWIDARRRQSALPAEILTNADLEEASRRLVKLVGAPLPRAHADDRTIARLASELEALIEREGVEDPAGRVLQEFRAAEDRKRHGAFYTPGWVVDELLDAAGDLSGKRVLDPACGSGAFLLAAARRGARVSGADRDREALEVARLRLALAGARVETMESGDLLADGGLVPGPWDAVLGNPPYVRFHALSEADRARLGSRFETARGQFDLFAPFLEAALGRVGPGGVVGYVLPALVLRGARYRELRRFLLDRARVLAVIDHGDGAFDGVQAPTCAIVLRRHGAKPSSGTVAWRRNGRTTEVDESRWREDEEAVFAPVSDAGAAILERLARFPRLATLGRFGRGIEIGKRHPALREEKRAGFIACLAGGDVGRFRHRARRWLEIARLPEALRPSRDDIRARLLVRETGERLTACRVGAGMAATRSLFHVRPHDPRLAAFLVGYLNSSVAQWWFATCVRADSGIFPKLRIGQLKGLRVPDDPRVIERVGELAQQRERAPDRSPQAIQLEKRIDAVLFDALGLGGRERELLYGAGAAASAG